MREGLLVDETAQRLVRRIKGRLDEGYSLLCDDMMHAAMLAVLMCRCRVGGRELWRRAQLQSNMQCKSLDIERQSRTRETYQSRRLLIASASVVDR